MESTLENAVRRLTSGYAPGKLPWTYCAVDPGATGAVAFVRTGAKPVCFVADIPTVKVDRKGGTKTEFNLQEIGEAFNLLRPYNLTVNFCVEHAQIQVAKRPGGAYTAFRVGYGFGIWPGVLAACQIRYTVVHPITWKTSMGLRGKDKNASLQMARSLFPTADLRLKKHTDRAEALLLAEWWRRKCYGQGA